MLIDFAISGVSESRTLENEQTRPTGSVHRPSLQRRVSPPLTKGRSRASVLKRLTRQQEE
jgi:hypothetical protein